MSDAIKGGEMISSTLFSELNPVKPFLKSPLVLAAQHGRFDVLRQLVRDLGFQVDAAEEFSGLNPLAAAVKAGLQVDKVLKLIITGS